MLVEIKSVRQIQDEPPRRWFSSNDMDLIVWEQSGNIVAFQLSYDKTVNEHALSWHSEKGMQHHIVDDGESRSGHYKATPILIENGEVDVRKIRQMFEKSSVDIDNKVRQVVLSELSLAI